MNKSVGQYKEGVEKLMKSNKSSRDRRSTKNRSGMSDFERKRLETLLFSRKNLPIIDEHNVGMISGEYCCVNCLRTESKFSHFNSISLCINVSNQSSPSLPIYHII